MSVGIYIPPMDWWTGRVWGPHCGLNGQKLTACRAMSEHQRVATHDENFRYSTEYIISILTLLGCNTITILNRYKRREAGPPDPEGDQQGSRNSTGGAKDTHSRSCTSSSRTMWA